MAKSKIYTRRGDNGETTLVSGHKVSKSNIRIEAYGSVDELNSFIACLLSEINNREDRAFLIRVQSNLFVVGGYLANDVATQSNSITMEEVERLENEIDKIDELLPPLRQFILPGGCKGSSYAHVCRTVCRRVERTMYQLKEKSDIEPTALQYINRLSDYFFLFARKENFLNNIDEIIWEKPL